MNAFEDGNNSNNDNNNNDNNNDPPGKEQGVVKKGKGRQKIRMAKIENDTNLQVTFSKRRAGVFKKASELSTLCGAESAVVVFSPGNKPHSFGHPDVETVANRFLHASSNEVPPRSNADQLILAHSEAAMQQRNHELIGIEAELERERQRKSALLQVTQHPLHDLNYQQLDQLKQSVLGFKQDLEAKVKNTAVLPYAPPFVNPGDLMNAAGGNGSYGTSFGLSSSSMNYGYTVQYPPVGAGSSSARAGSFGYEPSSGDGGGSQAAGNDDGNLHQGFGGEYRRPDQF